MKKRCCNTIQITNNFNDFGFNKVRVGAYDLLFQVNIAGGGALAGASVTINGETQVTNALGQTTFSIAPGTYPYTVVLADYTTINSNVVVVGDQTETVNMYLVVATTLFDAMTTAPTGARADLDNKLIYDLIDNSLWNKFDCFWMTAAETQQAGTLNWIKRAHDLTLVNAPAFTVDRGFKGDGATSYINTNYNANTQGVNFTLNNSSIGIYSRDILEGGVKIDMGCGTNDPFLQINREDKYYIINSTLNDPIPVITEPRGLHSIHRTSNNNTNSYGNTTLLSNQNTISTSIRNLNIFLCCRANDFGVPFSYSTKNIAFAFAGASMTTPENNTFVGLIENYLDAIGAGVI